jgi:hypothetical protein
MARTTRHLIEFDSLEGKLLLSVGIANPAVTVLQQKVFRFHLNGKLEGIPSGIAIPKGFMESAFPLSGDLALMGHVEGAFFLKYSYIPNGKLPDLSKATLVLTNQKGRIDIALNATGSHHYKFKIMSGTGIYTFASGKGNLTILSSHNSPAYTIKMQSTS